MIVNTIKRLEVIDDTGRAYVNMDVQSIEQMEQDGGTTLKIFVSSGKSKELEIGEICDPGQK